MSEREPGPAIGLIGAGSRGVFHLEQLYEIVSRDYFEVWDKPWPAAKPGFPFGVYHDYASEVPDWATDISGLGASVTAVCDPSTDSRARAVAVCEEHGDDPDTFETIEAFYRDGEFDTVIVASPNHTHTKAALPGLERDLDVFCEKPLAATLADHDRLIDAADQSDGTFYVGFNLRHSQQYGKLRSLIQAGAIGRLGMLSAHEVRVPFPWGHYYTQDESGGTLLEKDCHDFDLFNWYTGSDPVRVVAFGGQHVLDHGTDVNDHATVIVEYESGVKATLELCMYAPYTQPGDRVYAARGTDGLVRSGRDSSSWEVFGWDAHDTYSFTNTGGEHGGADIRMWKDVLQTFADGGDPAATARDAKKAAAVAIGAERSIAEGRIVEIDERYDLH
ncbi:Gfo/Idh/MocA family protein [Haloarchaeobius sp. HME9146]|uniref:Gfo/Idh/MocA family protein n=1 Tax=Haloarchaeobius sp. HME9146 TaxID=2978732 RepID=UPI0021C04C2C|nr:Gfo/Idh/MocA family oxidoreductase [Haloarchaeobius sp. HME9146]MCT9098034.1 Gfo/Idh/MocA family oxidoreductase [Haloarchaeobius sp. HME9146]